MKLSENFDLAEFLPDGVPLREIPPDIIGNLLELCVRLLQPARTALGVPLRVTSGWRLEDNNLAVGGASTSDHLTGRAADLQARASVDRSWEDLTFELFDWLRTNQAGEFGQLILEDRREFLEDPGKLCVHIALPTIKHPGKDDPSAILVSSEPRLYRSWTTHLEPLA